VNFFEQFFWKIFSTKEMGKSFGNLFFKPYYKLEAHSPQKQNQEKKKKGRSEVSLF